MWIAGGLVVSTLAVYAPVTSFDFVRYDDLRFVAENELVRGGLSVQGLRWAFLEPQQSFWNPLSYVSHMLDAELFGGWAGGHHATNALLHTLDSLLLFCWLQGLTGAPWKSGAVAALFALHPLHVESVAWIAERKDVLSACFGLLALWSYTRWARWRRARDYLACLLALVLGLMSKPMLVTLPCVFLLLDYWPLGRVRFGARGPGAAAAQVAGRLLLEKLPFFALAAVWSALTWNFQQSAMQGGAEIPLAARAANAVVSYIRYLGKACWPTDLALLYPHPNLPGGTPWSSGQIAGSALLLVLLSAAAVSMTRRRYAAVGWLWFVGMLIPVIGLVQVGHQAMADRYTYLPAIGLFVVVVWAAGDATTSLARRDPRWTGVVGLLAVAVLLSFGLAARAQVNLWQNSLTLFEHSLRLHPDQPELHNNLAVELRARGRLDEAIEHYRRAVGIRPDYEAAQFNLANALLAAGRPEEAVAHYRLAGGIARRARDGCLRRAEQYLHRGWAEGALAELSRALQIDPDSGPGHHLLGHALRLAGDVPGATRAYERAVELIPDEAVPQQSLGDALWLTGRREEAIVHYRRGLELAPDSERARERLERALEEEDAAAP